MNSTSSDIIEPTDWRDTRRSSRPSTIDHNSYRGSDFTPSQSKTGSMIRNSSSVTGQAYDETDGFFNKSNNSSNKSSSPKNHQAKDLIFKNTMKRYFEYSS